MPASSAGAAAAGAGIGRLGWIALAASLVAAASIVLYMVAPRREAADRSASTGGGETGPPVEDATKPKTPRLAVTHAGFEDMGKLLDELGPGYRHEVIGDEVLSDPEALGRFDAVFLACADTGEYGDGSEPTPEAKALRAYVARGGTLYSSDLRYGAIASAFPDLVDRAAVAQGLKQDLEAEVILPELRELVGPRIPLRFALEGWRPAAFRGEGVSVLLKGRLRTTAGVEIETPLAVRFPYGEGTVLFTSYHNEAGSSGVQVELLRFLVRETVAARTESRAVEAMTEEGVVPRRLRTFVVDPEGGRTEGTFLQSLPGPLKVALVFGGAGAKMELELISPDGVRQVRRGDSTLRIDVAEASRGEWRYVATAEAVPTPHFPALVLAATPSLPGQPVGRDMNPPLPDSGGNVLFEEVSLGNKAPPRRAPRIAVTKPSFDDMGKLLNGLGPGFRHTTLPDDALRRPGSLDRFDIVFLTCGGWPADWGVLRTGETIREGITSGELRPEIAAKVAETLRTFVEHGGTLYVSDLRDDLLGLAFPQRPTPRTLRPELLPEVLDAERRWLRATVPHAKIGTLADTMGGIGLSKRLAEQIDRLVAILEVQLPMDARRDLGRTDWAKWVREIVAYARLPAAREDVEAISRALEDRERAFLDSYRSRNRANLAAARREIEQTERRLKELRDRMLPDENGRGSQVVRAEVVDQGLRELLGGGDLPLKFRDMSWIPARFQGDDVAVLLRGEYVTDAGDRAEAPLLVKFPEGQGTVIFTSFHNEALNTRQEELLLRYIAFSAVTAMAEASADRTMLSGGFSPVKRSQISHSPGKPTVTRNYVSETSMPLRFALTFSGDGARLRLILISPNGQRYSKEVESSIIVQATGAPAGEWYYTVESIKVPYENFPFSVSVGKGAPPERRR